MRPTFAALPVRHKLTLLVAVTAGATLLIASATFLVYDLVAFPRLLEAELSSLADVVGPIFTPAVAFDYPADAERMLAPLGGRPDVLAACIYTRDGRQFASYSAPRGGVPCPAVPPAAGVRPIGDRLLVARPLLDGTGVAVGTLALVSDLSRMRGRFLTDAAILAIATLAATAVAVAVSRRLQRLISEPIRQLAAKADRVSDLPAGPRDPARGRQDEVAVLVDAFDGMVERIAAREGELRAAGESLRQSHRALEQYSRELEQRVAARTAELRAATEEAEMARDRALAASRAKSAFLANMSHELRTPLNAVIGYAELLKEEADARGIEGLHADLDRIRGAGQHLLALINDVLDLSKVEAGRMEVVASRFDLGELIAEVADTVRPLALRHGNRLAVEVAAPLGPIEADRPKLRQALLNLLDNACKFTDDGRVTLRASHQRERGTERVVFEVEDNGIGISPEQMERLFQPFAQGDSSIAQEYGGTGLGLVLSRRFCRLMGGDINVQSQPGRGSRFVLWLPLPVGGEPVARVAPGGASGEGTG